MQTKEQAETVSDAAPVAQDTMSDALREAVAKMMNRTPEERAAAQAYALATYKPRRLPPPGMTIFDVISGKWPGDETDEQIEAALEELS